MGNNIVVIAEHADGHIRPVTYEIISFAKKLQRSAPTNRIKVVLLADKVENLISSCQEEVKRIE